MPVSVPHGVPPSPTMGLMFKATMVIVTWIPALLIRHVAVKAEVVDIMVEVTGGNQEDSGDNFQVMEGKR